MANTYTQIHIHVVFVVKYRQSVIANSWKQNLYRYISTIVQENGHKMIIINGVGDHVHCLIGLRPNQALSDLMREVKANSSKWINEEKLTSSRFEWQSGFGAFSYSKSQLSNVINYIKNQEAHHSKKTFREEYDELLKEFKVDFDERYLFTEPQ